MPQLKQSEIDKIKAGNEVDGEKFQFAYGCDVNIVYPNPSSFEIFIGHAESTEQQYAGQELAVTQEDPIRTEIYDFAGNLVLAKQFEISGNVPSIDISELKRATYFLRIIGKEVDEVHQIIKE